MHRLHGSFIYRVALFLLTRFINKFTSTVLSELPKRLTAEKLYLIQPSTSSSDGILWCEIVVSSFFSEYFFEGLKPEDYPNEEIILEMPTDDFHRALKVDRPDKTIPTTLKLKLSREDFSAGQKRAHETTVGGSKQPVIVIQLNLQQYSSGRDLQTIRWAQEYPKLMSQKILV